MVFEGMDKDHDGSLSLQEVVETYRRVQARRPPAPTTKAARCGSRVSVWQAQGLCVAGGLTGRVRAGGGCC